MFNNRAFFTFTAQSPDGDGKLVNYTLPEELLKAIVKAGRRTQYHALQSAAETLRLPRVIVKDLMRKGLSEALCYVGKPQMYDESDRWECPKGYVFVVFVTAGGIIFEWGLEKCAADDDGMPKNHKSRFGKVIWPHNS